MKGPRQHTQRMPHMQLTAALLHVHDGRLHAERFQEMPHNRQAISACKAHLPSKYMRQRHAEQACWSLRRDPRHKAFLESCLGQELLPEQCSCGILCHVVLAGIRDGRIVMNLLCQMQLSFAINEQADSCKNHASH